MSSMIHHKDMIQLQNIMKKDNINAVLTNKDYFTSNFYWERVHQLLTSSTSKMIQNIEFIKLNKIILYLNMLKVTQPLEKKTYVKESRFSYIRPIHGSTRLIVYNSSNVTSM